MPYSKPAKGKIVRRLGINIFGNTKYDRLLQKKPNSPGKSPKSGIRRKTTDYGLQLIEKQKIRYSYGLSEKHFKNTFYKAKKQEGVAGENFIKLLESRLDNVVYRSGWAVSRAQARQMVSHRYFELNGKGVNIPSISLKPGDTIRVRNRNNIQSLIRNIVTESGMLLSPWISVDNDRLQAVFKTQPGISEAKPAGNMQAIVEFYSR